MGPVAVLERRPAGAGPRPPLEVVEPGRWVPPPPALDRERWPWAFAAIAWLVYLVVAWWLVYVQHFELNDAIAKTSAAHHVIASRDPHLGAIGFYWMPLPQFSQIPFVWVLQFFGQPRFAGPLVNTVWGAFTIPVVAAVGRTCRVPLRVRMIMTALYAVSPIAVFASINGMSEASSLFFLGLVALGYARWDRNRGTGGLALMSLALAGAMACRYEGLPLALAMAGICALQLPRERWGRTMFFVLTPTMTVFGLWLLISRLIVGDALYWYHMQVSIGSAASTMVPAVLGTNYDGVTKVVSFVGLMVGYFALLLAVGLLLSVVREGKRIVALIGHWTPALAFVAIVVGQLLNRTTSAAPRYFYPCWTLAVTASFAVIGEHGGPHRSRRFGKIVTRLVVVTAVATTVLQAAGFADTNVSSAEHEGLVFAPLVGRPRPQPANGGWDRSTRPWQELFHYVDPLLGNGKRLMFDTESSPQGSLFTRHPRRLVIPEDRDFEQTLAAPAGLVDYIVLPSDRLSTGTSKFLGALRAVVAGGSAAGTWALDYSVADVDGADGLRLYRFVPARGSGSPTATIPRDPTSGGSTPSTTAPATTAPATTAAPSTTVPAVLTDTDARVAVVTGHYPSGQAWPSVVRLDGAFVLDGVVPTAAAGLAIAAQVTSALGVGQVANRLVIDPAAPVPSLVGVRISDAPAFAADGIISPGGEAVVALWIARLQAMPALRIQMIVARDAADPPGAAVRAAAVRSMIERVDPTVVEQVTVEAATVPAGSPLLTVALATGLTAP